MSCVPRFAWEAGTAGSPHFIDEETEAQRRGSHMSESTEREGGRAGLSVRLPAWWACCEGSRAVARPQLGGSSCPH